MSERVPMDLATYEQQVRSGGCFICGFLHGDPDAEHELLYDDGTHVAFLNRYPTLRGYALVAPRRHVVDVVRELTPAEYLALQAVVHYVVAVGPFWTTQERAALTRTLPDDVATLWVVIDAAVSVTLPRALADPGRGLSRDLAFHHRAHRRFRKLLPTIPADRTFDSEQLDAEQIAAAITDMLGVG